VHAPLQPPALPVRTGLFHRLGLVTDRPAAEVADFFDRVLGAAPMRGGMTAVRGYPMGLPADSPEGTLDGNESGATADVRWVGRTPLAVFLASDEASPVAGFLARYGPGVHSLAWTVDDLWMVESLLRRHGVRITGTDLPGRHLFMHPKDAAGLLVEWTDTAFAQDPRAAGTVVPASPGAVAVRGVASVTALVPDAPAAAALLRGILSAEPVADGDDRVVALAVSDLVVRLRAAAEGHRLSSFTFAVDDLAVVEEELTAAGVGVLDRSGDVLVTDPADTLGWHVEWTAG